MLSACAASVSSVLNTSLQSRDAAPLAVAAGGSIGALVSWFAQCWNASASLHAGSAVGAALGAVSLQISRGAQAKADAHRLRWDFLQFHRGTRTLLRDNGVTFEQDLAVRHVYDHLKQRLSELIAGFRDHCEERGVCCNALVEQVLKHFYVAHCADHVPVVVSRLAENKYFIGAIREEVADSVRIRMNSADDPAGVFASEGAVHMVLDMQRDGDGRFRACVFEPQRSGPAEAQVRQRPDRMPIMTHEQPAAAAETLPGCRPQPLVELRRRSGPRHLRRTCEPGSAAVPVRHGARDATMAVVRGETLREQCAHLPAGSRTLSDIDRILEDLAHGRTSRHSVDVDGERYIARDVHLEGLSGRNRWRLLHRRVTGGYELVGIADYHLDTRTARWWNR